MELTIKFYYRNIHTTCKTCQLKMRPLGFFVHVPLDKSSNSGLYSLIFSYKIANDILKTVSSKNENEKSKAGDEYFKLIGNMIYYIDFKLGINNKISNYLATCLK